MLLCALHWHIPEPCKQLSQDGALLQASISAEHGRWDVKKAKLKGMRKMTPSQAQGGSPAVQARVPPSVAAAAAPPQGVSGQGSNVVKVTLQQAFLEQYSPAEAKASFLLLGVMQCSVLMLIGCQDECFTKKRCSDSAST